MIFRPIILDGGGGEQGTARVGGMAQGWVTCQSCLLLLAGWFSWGYHVTLRPRVALRFSHAPGAMAVSSLSCGASGWSSLSEDARVRLDQTNKLRGIFVVAFVVAISGLVLVSLVCIVIR